MTATFDREVEAVCFDLDDTLFDYEQYIRAGLREAASVVEARTGTQVEDELLHLYFEEDVRSETFDRVLDRHDLPDALVSDLVEAYHDSDGPLTPYDEADRVLDDLGSVYDLGLITDGRNARSKLRRLGLDGRFDVVFAGPNHDVTKRDPLPFEHTLDRLDVEPTRAVYVGDNPATDFRESNRLGMFTVRLMRGRYVDRTSATDARPDVTIDSLDALTDLVDAPDASP